MDSDRIYFRAATQADYDAIHLLAIEFNCSVSQIVRFALHEWLGDKFIKRLELAQAIKEVKEVSHDP